MNLKNLTPHPVTLRLDRADGSGAFDVTFPPTGTVARLTTRDEPAGKLVCDHPSQAHVHLLVPVARPVPGGEITGWTPADGPAIVSRMVLDAAPVGSLLFAPDTGPESCVRSPETGHVVAVRRLLARPPWEAGARMLLEAG